MCLAKDHTTKLGHGLLSPSKSSTWSKPPSVSARISDTCRTLTKHTRDLTVGTHHFKRWPSTVVCNLEQRSDPISRSILSGVSIKTPYPLELNQNEIFL